MFCYVLLCCAIYAVFSFFGGGPPLLTWGGGDHAVVLEADEAAQTDITAPDVVEILKDIAGPDREAWESRPVFVTFFKKRGVSTSTSIPKNINI